MGKRKTIEEFKKVLERDNNKKRLSKENGVKLVYFIEKRFNKYMNDKDTYFNNADDLINYISNDI